MLNHHLFQKFKPIRNYKINHLINILTLHTFFKLFNVLCEDRDCSVLGKQIPKCSKLQEKEYHCGKSLFKHIELKFVLTCIFSYLAPNHMHNELDND